MIPESLRTSLRGFRQARQQSSKNRCKLLGAHLEGPFLSPTFKGAHDSNNLCLPSLGALEDRIKCFEDEIKIETPSGSLNFEILEVKHI